MSPQAAADHVELLAREKARFLRFLERRVANRADAEDLLQTALLKVATETVPLRFEGKLVPWFYQVLRNLLVDHYRRAAALGRAKQRASAEARATVDIDDDLFRAICACVKRLDRSSVFSMRRAGSTVSPDHSRARQTHARRGWRVVRVGFRAEHRRENAA